LREVIGARFTGRTEAAQAGLDPHPAFLIDGAEISAGKSDIIDAWTGADHDNAAHGLRGERIMSDWNLVTMVRGPLRRAWQGLLALVVLAAAATMALVSAPGSAHADGIYIGGSGVGITIGTGGYRGYRGAFFYGPFGFSGPPYRPYGPPYYYHPYDMRGYPYRSRIYPHRSRVYVNPPRRQYYRGQPQRVPYTKTGLAPFTPQWIAYCSRKFKSFNPHTGMYLAYSGRYRFCR
jgi:hypothetical protein